MKFNPQSVDLNHRISGRQLLRFFQRTDTKYEDTAQLAVITEWPGHDYFLQVSQADDVRDVGFL